ncbi:hypothetical protein AK88_05050 [Plasmodium fragile]|uniref:Schizont-infected cell agglutination extracellular alpha domain-containing protein n=1 Tax=Plasmodium fragile TaxID=5857 RepID=A0A0D9QET6_PLAFR|nr:uncharacterized protein AK88_05050 [Plasmodium fragile]KJP85317.1 hypothetical protein AK88_05050 [Plasmodium fragile]
MIWTDTRQLFEVLRARWKKEDKLTKETCEAIYPRKSVGITTIKRIVCQRVMKVFLFMDRIDWVGENWAQSRIFKNEQVLEDYLRCMLGNVAIVEHFGKHCMHIEIVKAVSTAMSTLREALLHVDTSKKCEQINYNDLRVGSKLVGLTMAKWMDELRTEGGISPGKASATGGVCPGSPGQQGTRRADSGQGSVTVAGVLKREDQDQVKTFINKGKELIEQDRKALLNEVLEKGGDIKAIEKILDKVKDGKWQRDNTTTTNSRSKSPQNNGHSPGEQQATSSSTTSQAPGMSATGNTGTAGGPAKPAGASKPAVTETPETTPSKASPAATEKKTEQESTSKTSGKEKGSDVSQGPKGTQAPSSSPTQPSSSPGSPTTVLRSDDTTREPPRPAVSGGPEAAPSLPQSPPGAGDPGAVSGQIPGPGQQPPPPPPQQEGSTPGNNSRKEPPASAAGTSGPKVDEDGNKHNPQVYAPTPGEKESKVVESKTAETLLGTAVITTEITTTTYDPTGAVGMDTITKLLEEQEKKEKSSPDSHVPNSNAQEETTPSLSPGPHLPTPQTPSHAPGAAGPVHPAGASGPAGEKGGSGEAGNTVPAVADGGNDDPPPLNPPKPKPNPNPDQSGTSGSGGGADQSSGGGADGVSGGAGKGGADGGGQGGGSSGGGTGRGAGAAVGGAGGSPPSSGPSSDTNQQDQSMLPLPSKPFHPKDLIPYNPAIIPAVVCIGIIAFFLWKHPGDFDRHEEPLAKLRVRNRVARSLAKIKAIPSEHELVLDPMAFEHYDDTQPTYEGAYEGAYDDVDERYAQAYASRPKRIYCREQWTTPKKRCYRDGEGTILKEWKMVEYEIPQEVHYERKWKIEHDATEEEVDSRDTLSADMAVSASVEKPSTSVSKVGAQASLPPSLQNNVQNKGQSAKTKQEPQGSSGTGTTASTKHGKQNKAVNVKPGRDFSRRKLAAYILYRYCKFFVAAILVYCAIMVAWVYSVCAHLGYSDAATAGEGNSAAENVDAHNCI